MSFGREFPGTAPYWTTGLYGGCQQTDHCVTINLDDGMLRKVLGYNGQNTAPQALYLPQRACTNTYCLFLWKKSYYKELGGKTGGYDRIRAAGKWWAQIPLGNNPFPRPPRRGRFWGAVWYTQAKLHLGVTAIHLTLGWGIQHFWVQNMYPNCKTQAISTQRQQNAWQSKQHWPTDRKGLQGM